jgi:hypothetical protein
MPPSRPSIRLSLFEAKEYRSPQDAANAENAKVAVASASSRARWSAKRGIVERPPLAVLSTCTRFRLWFPLDNPSPFYYTPFLIFFMMTSWTLCTTRIASTWITRMELNPPRR